LQRNSEEIHSLFTQHTKLEEDYQQKRRDKEIEYTNNLEKLRTQDANDQQEQKIKLEKEMQVLQKCMEDMRAVYKLNEEKLEFNHRVLKERDKVNLMTIKNLKRRENKLRTDVRLVGIAFQSQSKIKSDENKKSTKEYKEFTNLYL